MKKNLLKILCGVVCACLLCLSLVACGGTSWAGTTMKTPGETEGYQNVGFVYETENYLYYINGVATSSNDNTFGKPVKGALMAIDKTDLSGKSEVVVPKLFASTSYKQGLFVKDGYVYYGTPSTDKTSSNTIAYNEMTFMRTKLDGTGSESYFTVSSLSTDYRFFEKDGVVYILYYDTSDTALVCYNTSTRTETEIAKTDATVQKETVGEDNEHGESLAAYKFTSVGVAYTVTVYNEEYNEDKLNDNQATRSSASYNKVYKYVVGEEKSVIVLGGINDGATYEIKFVKDGKFYFTQVKNGVTKNLVTSDKFDTESVFVDADAAVEGNIIANGVAYSLAEGKVYKQSVEKDNNDKQIVAVCDTISTMLFVKDGELYYVNSSTQLAKIELDNEDAHEVVLTESTVVTTWYTPSTMTIGETDYIFFADSSSLGLNYVKYVKLDDAQIIAEDTNDDGKDDKWAYAESATNFLGQISDADKASVVTAKINAISNKLVSGDIELDKNEDGYIVTDGKYSFAPVTEARAAYEALSATAKASVTSTALELLENYEKAIEMMALYIKLEGIDAYVNMPTDTAKTALESAYNEIKADIVKFMESDEFATVGSYIKDQYKWYFQKAQKIFEPETK